MSVRGPRTSRRLAVVACAWVVVACAVLLVVPVTGDGVGGRETLLERGGATFLAVVAVLVAGSVAAVAAPERRARGARIAAGLVVLAFSLVGAASIGLFFLAPAIGFLAAAATAPRPTGPAGGRRAGPP